MIPAKPGQATGRPSFNNLFRRLAQECHFDKATVLRLTLSKAIIYLSDPDDDDGGTGQGVEIHGPEDWAMIMDGLERESNN